MIVARTGHLALALALVVGLAACGGDSDRQPDSLPLGSSEQRLDVEGVERTYRAYRPDSLPEPAPMVLMLHGSGETAQQAESTYGWQRVADEEGVLVVHPDGLHRTWNTEGGCCGQAQSDQVDDVAFLEALIAHLSGEVDIDPERVYVTGMSNGAMMAYTLACRTDVIAAIAPVAGTMLDDCADPRPVSVHHIHGLLDRTVPFDGSPASGMGQVDGPSVPEVIDFWRTVDGCLAPSLVTAGPVQRSVSGCAEGGSVELVTIDGSGHRWPGAGQDGGTDVPSETIVATEAIWRFFAAHSRVSD